MDIYVLDGLNGIFDVVDTYESVIWNIQYFGKSDFELVVIGSDKNISTLQEGTYLCRDIDISDNEYRNVMMIKKTQLSYDYEKGWILTVTGTGLKNIVNQRVIWNQTNLTGTIENCIRQVISDNIINPTLAARKINNFILADELGLTDTMDVQCFGENIAEWLESICTTYSYGWDVYISDDNYVFELYQGTDRTYNQSINVPVVFSPEYDNLLSSTYTYTKEEYKNAALIGGEGEGTAQRMATIGTSTGLERYEMYVDGGSVSSNGEIITPGQYTKMLEDYGNDQISQTAYTKKFDSEIEPVGMYELNKDYFLGDLVQIDNGKGITATSRIIEIIYSEDENGTSVVPTFSEWEVE